MKSRRVKQIEFFTKCFEAEFKIAKSVDNLIGSIKNRGALRLALRRDGVRIARNQQAHHILPIEALKQCRLMQKAVLGGFKINGSINGIPLSLAAHKKVHDLFGNYNRMVMGQFLSLEARLGSKISQSKAKEEVEQFVEEMAKQIKAAIRS